MNRDRKAVSVIAIALLTLSLSNGRPAHAQADKAGVKTPLRIEDLYLFDGPKSPVLFPDGKRAVYIRNWIDATSKQERNSLWIVEGENSSTGRP